MLNTAKSGGSIAFYMSDSLIDSCSFTSSNASRFGGCIYLEAANVTVKHSNLSRCRSEFRGGSVNVFQQSTLRLENVMINNSYSRFKAGTIYVLSKSELFMTDSVLIDCHSEETAGIRCYGAGRMYLESISISSCSSSVGSECLYSFMCDVTMDNNTFTDTDYAISVIQSKINIFNSLIMNEATEFLTAKTSEVIFGNLNISGVNIDLDESVAKFQHTVFIIPEGVCPIKDQSTSNITLKSVYVPHTTNRSKSEDNIVCKGSGTVVHGNTSGELLTCKELSNKL